MELSDLRAVFDDIQGFLAPWEAWLWALGIASLLFFLVSLLALPWAVSRIPADYFTRAQRRRAHVAEVRPWLYWPAMVLKNLLGVLLLLAGLAMLVLPGQGILTLFAGMLLLNFPGKYRLERWLVMKRAVHRPVNWLRARHGARPLDLPGQDGDGGSRQTS